MREVHDVFRVLAPQLRGPLEEAGLDWERLQEIRIRVNCPLMVRYREREQAVLPYHTVKPEEIEETMRLVSGHSLYAFAEEIRQGFLTLPGGHRLGICGLAVTEREEVVGFRQITFLALRLAHQVPGCADGLTEQLTEEGRFCHTLILSPPGCGKTTLLRDLIRQLSNGTAEQEGRTVAVVDERMELSGSWRGIPQNDLGVRTDILSGCPKAEGISMLLRTMTPEILAVDELGAPRDIEAAQRALYCGCSLLATAHADSFAQAAAAPGIGSLIKAGVFERYIILERKNGKSGHIRSLLGPAGEPVTQIRKAERPC